MKNGIWEEPTDRIGTGRRTAYALAIFPLDIVHRSTIRALLPIGRMSEGTQQSRNKMARTGKSGRGRINIESDKYRQTIRTLDRLGYIDRGREFLRIKDRGALLDHALMDLPRSTTRVEFVRIAEAVEIVKREVREAEQAELLPGLIEQRRRELVALQGLMRATPGGDNWSGAGSVRFVPRGRAL